MQVGISYDQHATLDPARLRVERHGTGIFHDHPDAGEQSDDEVMKLRIYVVFIHIAMRRN